MITESQSQDHNSLDTPQYGCQFLVYCKYNTNLIVNLKCTLYYIQVIKKRLAGPDFVWFIPGWFRANWWAAVDGIDCTADEMKKSLEHTLGGRGDSVLDSNESRLLVSNKV